ncbi:trichohyalin isoform X5 [Micropterus dolomieu]|nr:trichohyalin isoform X5 [Micropterus dolomieu]XP_045885638.1 trichohyalin isoform X5 [Micropterus dolomieu]XP_045885639.1 trichohyalin isoform X5 [Micropterus dolomieu]
MLSPSSSAQKNLGEEDSSGSDAGSEVGLEPETDRFGFIVTNGSTAGSVGPPPELVRQREAKWINIIGQWDRILLKKTSKVKVQCQKGIPASLRAKCWPLLCGATDRMKQNENLYQSLDSQPTLQSWVDVIERDLDRQFPFHEMFLSKDGHGQRGLFRVLKAYTQYQPEEGYCQAQGPVTAVLLMNMPAEEAFWCLVQISEQYLPGYYSPLLEGVLFDAAMLTWVLKRTCPAAHKHLQHHEVEPLMFATDWLMCLFTRHLPFNTLLRVWDLFFCYGVRVLLQVAVVLVRRVLGRAEQRKQCQGQMETLERLRGVREQVQEEDDTFIAEVCSVQLSARDLEKQTEKELVKWRKDRPSSTFDPRRRCQGYRMAWARARQSEEERDRKEREKGNLSVPLARSASTLSLSPSLLHKRWRKGGKVNTSEWEGGGKVVRHLSMGAKEDWRSWAELDFKKVQGVQEEEDVVSEEHKKQPKLTGQTEKKEFLEGPKEIDKIQTIPTEQVEETVIVKEQIEQVEKRVTEKEKSHLKETDEGKMLSEQTEETNMDAEPTQYPDKDQTVENIPQPIEETADHKPREELNSCSQSQVLEQQSHQSEDPEIKDKETNTETEKQVSESEHSAAVEENQTETQSQVLEQQSHQSEDQEIKDKETNTETEKQVSESEHSAAVEENQTETQSQVLEQQSHQSEDQEIKDKETNTETEKQVSESEHSAAVEENQTETQSQVLEQQSHQSEDQEIKDKETNTETEKQVSESEHSAAVEENQTETQSQVLEQQSHQSEDQEIKDKETNTETEKQVSESEHSAAVEENQTETQSQVLEQQSHQSEDQEIKDKETNTETEKQVSESEHSAAVEENQTETQSQVLEQQSHQSEDQEIKDKETNTETEKQVSESEHSAAVEENQTETQSQVLEQQSHQSEDQEIKDKETNTETEKQVSESEHSAAVEENQTETQSQVLEQQSHQSEDQEIKDKETNTETEKQVSESEHSAAVEENQTETQKDASANTALKMEVGVHTNKELTILADVKPEESTETESVQRMQVDTVTEVSETTTEASPGSETVSVVIAPPVTDPTAETEAQEQQQQVIPEREESSQGEEFEGKCHSTESLAETDMKEESHTHTETETDVLAQAQAQAEENAATQDKLEAEIVQIDSKQHIDLKTEAETPCSPQSIQPQEGTDLAADTETEAEVSVANDVATESSEAFAQCPEEQRDAAAPQPTQEVGEIILTTRSVAQVDNDQTATETQLNEETHSDSIAPPQKEGTSSQAEAMNLTTEPDGKASSVETTTSGEPEETKVTVGAAEVEESTENVEENKVGEDDVFISTEPTDSANTDSNPQVQERDSHQTEPSNSGQTQLSGRRSSRSSGDFCVRKSSSSRGSRLGRRLSEDLFTMPQKTSQSQAIPNQPEVEAQSSPGAVNPNLTPPEVTSLLSAEVTERTAVQQQQQPPPDPPKRFGLFRRLRGEQPKKAKGTPKMQVPKILIQDFSDGTETGKPVEEEGGEKVSSRERRRRRREQERRQKEEERLRKKREKEEEKEKERERRKPQTRGKSFQVQRDKGSSDAPEPAKTGSQTLRYSASCAESYF